MKTSLWQSLRDWVTGFFKSKAPVIPPLNPPVTPPADPPAKKEYQWVNLLKDNPDRGPEIWIPNWDGCQIRLSANDSKSVKPGPREWFPLDHGVVGQAVELFRDENKDTVVVGHDFVSPRTGQAFVFRGLVPESSSNDLVPAVTPGASITVPRKRMNGALRLHWSAVKSLSALLIAYVCCGCCAPLVQTTRLYQFNIYDPTGDVDLEVLVERTTEVSPSLPVQVGPGLK